MKVVGSRAWVHIPKKKRVKHDVRSWQGIFIDYEGKNQYRVYNPRTGKVHITRDLFVDEQHLYHREALNDWDYSEDDWAETDDTQFADVSDFDDSESDDSLYSVGDDNFSKQLEKEGNDSEDLGQDITTFDNLGSELSEPPEEELWQHREFTSIRESLSILNGISWSDYLALPLYQEDYLITPVNQIRISLLQRYRPT